MSGQKSQWGALKGRWGPHDKLDQIIDYVEHWTKRTELPVKQLLEWMGLGSSKFHQWRKRYGQANEHNGKVPRDWWLEEWEKLAILGFHDRHSLDGYDRSACACPARKPYLPTVASGRGVSGSGSQAATKGGLRSPSHSLALNRRPESSVPPAGPPT
jgi:hypothetical protein